MNEDQSEPGAPAELIVIGSAQDGGVPHAGCRCERCERARRDPGFRRYPASLGIVDGESYFVIDATTAFAEQYHLLRSARPEYEPALGTRYSPPDAIVITHAHTGHYIGLWQLDRSVMAAASVRVLAPPLTAGLLRTNEPWVAMTHEGFVDIEDLDWCERLHLSTNVSIEAIQVPHRSEWPTDTACLKIEGLNRTVLYLPDIDSWDAWDRDILDEVKAVDIAILDGSFWDAPTSANVPHPPMTATLDILDRDRVPEETQIVFTHLNHTNPTVDPDSEEARLLRNRGFEVATDGMRIPL